jgi:rhomboid family GlyGly-CTERM serine protease
MTLSLLAVLAGLHWLVPDKTLLYFSAADISRGDAWRIVSGHLVHADLEHLLWNSLGLAVLGAVIEYRSRASLLAALGAGMVFVSALLLSPWSPLVYYCGLSGVLNTLLLVALWQEWRISRSWLLISIALGSVAKLIFELSQGVSIVTNVSWPPYAWSHLAGLTAGLAVVWVNLQYTAGTNEGTFSVWASPTWWAPGYWPRWQTWFWT